MKFKKESLITIAGTIWFVVGSSLLVKGLRLVIVAATLKGLIASPIIHFLTYAVTGAIIPSLLIVIFLGLFLGYFKGRWALAKAARKTINRLYPMEGRIVITKLYRLHDYLLLFAMFGLGRLMHSVEIPNDLHGLIDITVGSALVNGAMIYFRYAIKHNKKKPAV